MRIYFVGEFDDKVKEEYKQFWFIEGERKYKGDWFYRINIVGERFVDYKDWLISIPERSVLNFLSEMKNQQWDVIIYWDCYEEVAKRYKRKLFKRIRSNSPCNVDRFPETSIEYFLWEEYKNKKDYFMDEDGIRGEWDCYVVRADSIVNYTNFDQSCENFKVVDRISYNIERSIDEYNYRYYRETLYRKWFDKVYEMDIKDKNKLEILKILKEMPESWRPLDCLICKVDTDAYATFMIDHTRVVEKLRKECWFTEEKANMLVYDGVNPIVMHPEIFNKNNYVLHHNIRAWVIY